MAQVLPINSPSHSESQLPELSGLQEVAPKNEHPLFAPEPPAALLRTGLIGGSDPVALGWHSNQHPVRTTAMPTWADHPGLHPAQPQKRQLISKQNLRFWLIQFALALSIPSYLPTFLLPSLSFYVKRLLAILQ